MEGNEKSSLLGKARYVGERLVEVGGEAARLKTAASHAVEHAVTEPERLAKRSRYAAEDLMEDAAHRDNCTFKNNGFRPTYFDPASLKCDLKRIGFADVQ